MPKILLAIFIFSQSALFGFTNSYAQNSETPSGISDIYVCKSISNAMQRLNCYDTVTDRLEVAEESGELITIKRSTINQVNKDSFGLNSNPSSTLDALVRDSSSKEAIESTSPKLEIDIKSKDLKVDNVDEVKLVIKKTTTFGRQKTRFFFTNGQVWDQVDDYRLRTPRAKGGNSNTATIRTAALGSFFLRVNGKGRAIRVRRIR